MPSVPELDGWDSLVLCPGRTGIFMNFTNLELRAAHSKGVVERGVVKIQLRPCYPYVLELLFLHAFLEANSTLITGVEYGRFGIVETAT